MSSNKLDFIPGTTVKDGDKFHIHARKFEYFKPEWEEKDGKMVKPVVKKVEVKKEVLPFDCNKCDFSTPDEAEIKKHVKTHMVKKTRKKRVTKGKDERSGDDKEC